MIPPLKLAYFSPLVPTPSGIAQYSTHLLPYLTQYAEITLFTDSPTELPFPTFPIQKYPEKRFEFDLPFYQMGNNLFHAPIYEMATRYPGVILLHDRFIHHLIATITAGAGNYAAYTRELCYELGATAGYQLAQEIKNGRSPHPFFSIPLTKRLLDSSLGIIIHSQFIQATLPPTIPNRQIHHPIDRNEGISLRNRLPINESTTLLASFGQITTSKRIDLALDAFQQIHQKETNTHYLIVGQSLPEVDLPALIAERQLTEAVTHHPFVPDYIEFNNWVATADIIINLRAPTIGESSGTAMQALALGKPLIVYNHGWYQEIPDDAAIKLPPLDNNALIEAITSLISSPERRTRLSEAAQKYVTNHCNPDLIARQQIEFINNLIKKIAEKND